MPYLTETQDGRVLLAAHVLPKSSTNTAFGVYDGSLKIAVTSSPVDGKANKAVTVFLAKLLHVGKRNISLSTGQTSRRKIFSISGVEIEEIRGLIESVLAK